MKKFYNSGQAADYLTQRGCPIAAQTLRKLRCVGGGPVFQKSGHFALYSEEGLNAFVQERLGPVRRSTTDAVL